MRPQLIRAAAGAGLVILAVAGIAATRPAAVIAGRPTFDRVNLAEATFPYPHLVITRALGNQAVLTFDDGTVAPAQRVIYQVPANAEPTRAGDPLCDTTDMICWGTTTVDPALTVRVELDYIGTPCVIVGGPTDPTKVQCSQPAG